jgi:alkaline phosphatase
MINMTGPAIPGTLMAVPGIDKRFPRGCGIDNAAARLLLAGMKWRNQLLALFCLFVFAALGVLYFKHWVIQKPFGIILFIGEGLAPERLTATRVYIGGADSRLALDSMSHLALMTNYSRDFAVADQAAAASAIATGTKVNNRSVAVSPQGKTLPSIVDLAREHGRAIGLVTNSRLTNATCAAFYAHTTDPGDEDNLAVQLVTNGKIDIALGGGAAQFLPEKKGGERQDERDLLQQLRRNGFDIVRTRAQLDTVPAWRRPKLFGVFGQKDLAFANQIKQASDQPGLPDMVRRAIQLLQYNPRGYLLVVDAGLMRKAAEQDDAETTFGQTAELDRAAAVARSYSGAGSTIIVCGDVAIGGLSLNGFPFRKDSGLALLGLNSAGQPWITWATGPKGTRSYGAAKTPGETAISQPIADQDSEPAAFYTQWALETVESVVALGDGPGTEMLHGSIDNTRIFEIIRDEL